MTPSSSETIKQVGSLTVELGLIIFLTLLGSFFTAYLVRFLSHRFSQERHPWLTALLRCAQLPLQGIIGICGATALGQTVLDHTSYDDWIDQLGLFRHIVCIWLGAWLLLRWRQSMEQIYREDSTSSLIDKATVGALGKLASIFILFTAVYTTLEVLQVSLKPLLAIGGAGAVASGLAARDIVANLFTGFVLFVTRPFAVGDWIKSQDKNLEGVVTKIGWYQTEVRNFERRPIYVPNSLFSQMIVVNASRMTNRRIREDIGIRYDDIEHLPTILKDIRAMLREHPDIEQNLPLMAHFTSFAPSSLTINVYCFTVTRVWKEWRATQEDILLQAAKIIEKHGAEIAFPTTHIKFDSTQEFYAQQP